MAKKRQLKKCSFCGKEIISTVRKCRHCKEWQIRRIKCPICGELISDAAKICPFCGESQEITVRYNLFKKIVN